jgi:hypothetical protein
MKNFKSLIALAVMASLSFNAINAHAYVYAPMLSTGTTIDASGNISVSITTLAATPATQIAVSFKVPVINADGTLDRSRATMVDVPALTTFSHILVPTPLQGHNCWVFVVTDVDKTNQIKVYWAN